MSAKTPSAMEAVSAPVIALDSAKETTKSMTLDTTVAAEPAVNRNIAVERSTENVETADPKLHAVNPQLEIIIKEAGSEETESEPEKQPKKRVKMVKNVKKSPKTPGRRKKVTVELSEKEEQEQVVKKVAALSEDIRGKFGQIAWAKMGGYPYWPCIITDPRLLPRKLQQTAMKTLESKFMVFFYVSKNFALVSFKKIESWDDTKFAYREGYPEKDSKAPKRRVKLMEAIDVADKEIQLPIEERANGLLKREERTEATEELVEKPPAPVKRKPGRPPKAKPLVKTAPNIPVKKRLIKDEPGESVCGKEVIETGPAVLQHEEEGVSIPSLSKEEIKAKVASRKAPKKKVADDVPVTAGAFAKKPIKATARNGKSSSATEIDSKRKREIELVVPHKSVKSADIREMTEEAAKKKLIVGSKSKAKKDKGDYNVGDLAFFASKMARLYANESSRNNDELVGMMQELFKEALMYRSDVERSGLAAIIARLRKSLSPTVGHTASALRKHMINILKNDTDIARSGKRGFHKMTAHGTKKRKTEASNLIQSQADQVKEELLSGTSDNKEVKPATSTALSPSKNESPVEQAKDLNGPEIKVKDENASIELPEKVVDNAAPVDDQLVKMEAMANSSIEPTENRLASPTKIEVPEEGGLMNDKAELIEKPGNVENNRKVCVDMLSKILDQDGSNRADLAAEIEAALFERFKETNEDYLTQARIIIFGLKENDSMRKRLVSGALHCLELAYADHAFFKETE